jgi:hypothetical protein
MVTLTDIEPKAAKTTPTAAQVSGGIPVPPVRLLQVMSAEDWEGFTEEWLTYHKSKGEYDSVKRYSGAGDLGLDVVAFTSPDGFSKPWDSYQCKHYDHALEPGDMYGEVGKIIYHSFNRTPPFNQKCRVPRRHVFVSPCGVGITVGRWLKDPNRFKEAVREKWESHCVPKIGTGVSAPLESELLQYFDNFDFSIFDDRTGVELIEEHAQTPFYAPRFGGGLPPRETPAAPPAEPTQAESPYLTKLLKAYGDHLGQDVTAMDSVGPHPGLEEHYNRQRVLFYSAESLRNFARDRTPPLTFESLQDDVYHGVIDINEAAHADALACLRATVSTAGQVDVGGNALVGVTRVADKQGICHQLANDDRLNWVKSDD